jgi:hypothetical protein
MWSRRGRDMTRMIPIGGDFLGTLKLKRAVLAYSTSTLNVSASLMCIVSLCLLSLDSLEDYILKNSEWKMDIMPEIMDGKNIADFIDPDIAEKLEALEREEEKLEAEGFYDSDEEIVRQRYNYHFPQSNSFASTARY